MAAKLKRATHELNAMGKKRQTEFEQREFLMEIAAEFQDIVNLAIHANYGRSEFFDEYEDDTEAGPLRLATEAVARGAGFAADMEDFGHEIAFGDPSSGARKTVKGKTSPEKKEPSELKTKAVPCHNPRRGPTPDEIVDILPDLDEVPVADSDGILDWILSVYRKSRGFEISTFDPALVSTTMKRQARKWEALAQGYVSDIVCIVHRFIVRLLEYLSAEYSGVASRLSSVLLDELRGKYEAALRHVEFLLKVELEGIPATYNRDFRIELEKWFVIPNRSH